MERIPCVSTTSPARDFAHGSTASGASLSLTLFNPTATDAVVDVSLFSQTAGRIEPPAYQGVPVLAGSAVVETLGDHDPNDQSLATEVTPLTGTIVAAEVANQGPSNGGAVSLLNGVTSPATLWAVAGNAPSSSGPSTVFTIFNPSAGVNKTVAAVFLVPVRKVADVFAVGARVTRRRPWRPDHICRPPRRHRSPPPSVCARDQESW